MSGSNQSPDPRHPIQVVARRTGLSADLIRAWERRYGAVAPRRTATNRRLYSDDDIERLRHLRLATLGGRRIGDIAGLRLEELRALIADDEALAVVSSDARSPAAPQAAEIRLEACMSATERFDGAALGISLEAAAVELTTPQLFEHLLMPLMQRIGAGWREGSLRVAHEHMATSIVRSFLGSLNDAHRTDDAAPEMIVSTPAGQAHELGAMTVAVAAAADGWRVTYLGADLPAEEIAAAAGRRNAGVVALSITYPADDPRLAGELRTLRRQLGADVALIAGGSASAGYADALTEVAGRRIVSISELRQELERVRCGRS